MSDTPRGIPAPPGHLGLRWQVCGELAPELLPEVSSLHVGAPVGFGLRLPPQYLRRLYLPSGPRHLSLLGRDYAGRLRAIGTVRCHLTGSSEDARCDAAIVRAMVDPAWRGRGLGRAILSWQYDAATTLLTPGVAAMIAAPIPAGNLDRRRLYAAAGFCAHMRLEALSRPLGDWPEPQEPTLPVEFAEGWVARPLTPADTPEIVRYLTVTAPDPNGFIASGLTPLDAVELAEDDISRVYFQEGILAGVALLIRTTNESGKPHGMVLAMHLSGRVEEDVRLEALYDATHALWTKGMRGVTVQLTPAGYAEWGEVLQTHAWTSIASDPLYGIEL